MVSLNPFKLIKLTKSLDTLEDQIDSMPVKSLFLSKTFWFNLATFLLCLGDYLPHKWQPWVVLIGNLILRLITDQSATIDPRALVSSIVNKLSK